MNFKPETIQALEKAFSVNSDYKLLVVTDPRTKKEFVWQIKHKQLARGQYNTQEVTREQFLEHTKVVTLKINEDFDLAKAIEKAAELETSKEENQLVPTEPVKEEETTTEVVEAPKEEAQPAQAKPTKKTTKKDV
ncbi:hypothetical protein V9L05_18770 [Bernardetia sp. Wsw4-3y2]|uniref:hypothetical protein n=1 Tax=Bernardetia sp. Wsw4-3y2 TaxID=3127471 RepID=UPI0030CDDED2